MTRRLAVVIGVAVATLGVVVACGGGALTDNTSGPAGADAGDPAAQAQSLFLGLEPTLTQTCGDSTGVCHVQGLSGAPPWLKGADGASRYISIKGYDASQSGGRKFITEVPEESRLFTKLNHEGPPLDGTSALGTQIKAWIAAENAAAKAEKGQRVTTDPISIADGTQVTISLTKLGSGMKGSTISFNVELVGSLLTLSSMTAHAPAANGIRLQHPLFIQFVGNTGTPDPGDSCANVDTKVAEGQTATLGPGTLVFPTWNATAKLAIAFDAVGPYTVVDAGSLGGDGGGATGGCKNVAGFQSIAADFTGSLSLNCVGCHAGGNAQNAVDMSALASQDYKTACAQILFAVDPANKPGSRLILAPTGGLNHQGGTLAAADQTKFKNDVLNTWLSGE